MERLGLFEISFVHSEDKELTVPAPFRTPQSKFRFCPETRYDMSNFPETNIYPPKGGHF